MASHPPRFLAIVEDARKRIQELGVDELERMLESGARVHLLDVREASEYAGGHIPRAEHLSKGVIERDIEHAIPGTDEPIVVYCGGGFRSALAADNLQKMGYENVRSLAGGFRSWKTTGLPIEGG